MSSSFEDLSSDDKSAHLLDYVQGRLSDAEKLEIDAAIANNDSLAEELAYYQGIAAAVDEAVPAADHEFGWAKLSKAIDLEATATPVTVAANDNSNLWKVATLALGLVAFAQGAFLVSTGSDGQVPQESPIYVPVTSETTGFDAQIIFTNTATSARMNEILTDLDAQIVAGPSALGLYDIRFESESAREVGLEVLRTIPDIVESVTLK